MGYLPKSKYKLSYTAGREYINTRGPFAGVEYKGPIIVSSEGVYAGDNPKNLSHKLRKAKGSIESFSKRRNLWPFEGNSFYDRANKNASAKRIGNTKTIVSTKNIPTEKDYERGHYTRYFCQRRNSPNILYEINKKIFDSLNTNNKYDSSLYKPGSLLWGLEGNVILANTVSINKLSIEFPYLSTLFPKLDEYLRYKEATHQIAEPGMLVYENEPTKEYVGLYHVHPKSGPMEGPVHVPEKHNKLRYTDKYYNTFKPVETDPEGLKNGLSSGYKIPKNVKSQITRVVTPTTTSAPTPSTPPPSTPSYGGGSSGGGGGGY